MRGTHILLAILAALLLVSLLSSSTVAADETVTIDRGEYHAVQIRVSRLDMGAEVKYSYEVVSGSEIDVFLMDSQQYERYSTWSNLFDMDNMLPGSSLSNMSDHKEVTLPPGSYYLVFDNTDVGPSKAGDRVGLSNDVSFEFTHPEPPPVEIEHLIVFGAIFSLILIVPLTVNHLPTIDVSTFIGEHANAFSLVFSLLGGFLIAYTAYTAFIIAASSSLFLLTAGPPLLAGLAIMALGVAQFIDRDKAVEIGLIIAILSMINLLLGVIGLGTVLALIGGLMAYGSCGETS